MKENYFNELIEPYDDNNLDSEKELVIFSL